MKKLIATIVLLAFIPFASGLIWIQPARFSGGASYSEPAGTAWISAQTLGTPKNDFTGGVGCKFTADAAITISALGRWKIAGNTGTHTLKLYDSVGAELASTSVNMGQAGTTAGTYIYASITPVLLTNAASYYVISFETNAGDTWYDEADTFATGFNAGAGTLTNGVYHDGTLHDGSTGGKIYGPVNFKF
jgi:hypothetical protein